MSDAPQDAHTGPPDAKRPRSGPSAMDIERDRLKVERAMRKRARQMKAVDPIIEDRITEYDQTLFGRPVRIEIDVCIPIDDLKRLLSGIRADLTNALMVLEQTGAPNDRRFTAHQQLQRARAKAYILRQELLLRGKDHG